MKFAIRTIILAVAISPALAFASQSSGGLTRAEVRAQIVQVEKAGYNPARKDIHYPQSIQQAEARIRSSETATQADASGYGPAQPAGFGSGSMIQRHASSRSLYAHH
ncbi:DUF4148 domain-containing protein [Burkholderia diffusa]|uniref:Purine nucleoside phosphorylase n=1 Tax=Burkholderia diffusa TaxID=488732 RepID=A0A6P2QNY6_9BURK|nr:DUF4148 domain-containing protein [Burkholderia diffusa]KAB0655727.1 DUF4148 domain-containing protein [Burkholderia diffusa]MBM2656830.1 DUF4148 domain-containing protein [Burkholderia diffusa]VWC25462.1 purine nucleoside phosphorylase [Burkholderia diffusa]